eukprot:1079455-Pyramimonas_sp.AAC.1
MNFIARPSRSSARAAGAGAERSASILRATRRSAAVSDRGRSGAKASGQSLQASWHSSAALRRNAGSARAR